MPAPIDLEAWDYELPADRIARHPPAERDGGRLLVVDRRTGGFSDRRVTDLPSLLSPGDLVVVNTTRVFPARLRARRRSGGACELLVLELGNGPVAALVRPARKLRVGDTLSLEGGLEARICSAPVDGVARVDLGPDPLGVLQAIGEIPLPPYLGRSAEPNDATRYQTLFADVAGSAAAPTAGLHFTPAIVAQLAARGIPVVGVQLHVGLGTFRPLRPEDLERGRLHEEEWAVPAATATRIAQTRAEGGRVIAIGTTTARTLEAATRSGDVQGRTDLLIAPGYEVTSFDFLFTNFHLPGSSLLLLVGALLGREGTLAAYAHAVRSGYRFYSYGDAMLVL